MKIGLLVLMLSLMFGIVSLGAVKEKKAVVMSTGDDLLLAVKKGDVKKVRNLVEKKKADVNYCSIETKGEIAEGSFPLLIAIFNERKDVILYLESKGAKIDKYLYDNQITDVLNSTFFDSCRSVNEEIALAEYLKWLGEHYSKYLNLNALNNSNKETPLSRAAFNKNFPIFKVLVELGANINDQSDESETPSVMQRINEIANETTTKEDFVLQKKFRDFVELEIEKNKSK